MALTRKEISERFYRKRKENGLCPRCGKKLDREGHYCLECLVKHREQKREDREFYKEHGICPCCGKEKLFGDERQCINCREKNYQRKANISDEKKEMYAENFKKQQKNLYKERAKNGICTRCGKRKAEYGKKKCRICLDKDMIIHRKRLRMKKPKEKEDGICFFCDNPVMDGKTICEKHFEIFSKNGKRNAKNHKEWRNDNKFIFNDF